MGLCLGEVDGERKSVLSQFGAIRARFTSVISGTIESCSA